MNSEIAHSRQQLQLGFRFRQRGVSDLFSVLGDLSRFRSGLAGVFSRLVSHQQQRRRLVSHHGDWLLSAV